MQRAGFFSRLLALCAVLLMATSLASCSSGGSPDMPALGEQAPANDGDVGAPQEDGDDAGGDGDRLIIRSKTLRLEVDGTPETIDQIRDLTRTRSGTISDMKVATDSEEWLHRYEDNGTPAGDGAALRGWVTVRVPVDDYEDFVAEVAKFGVVKFQSEATSDVTQEHADLSARLENLRAQEVRLREFFEAAKDVEDMLAIETELGRVRGEIESLDAQVTYLERQAAMATVTIELTEPRAVVRPGGESWGFADAITNGVRGAAELTAGLLAFLIATSPLWISAIVLFFPIRALLRRRRGRTGPTRLTGPPAPPETPRPVETGPATGE